MRNAGLEEAQAGIKIAGRNINNLILISHLGGARASPLEILIFVFGRNCLRSG